MTWLQAAIGLVAFRVLPLILLISAISAVLFHWGVLPFIIRWMARGLQRLFRVSGALAFAAAASVFFGIMAPRPSSTSSSPTSSSARPATHTSAHAPASSSCTPCAASPTSAPSPPS